MCPPECSRNKAINRALESSSLVHEQGVNEGKIHLPTGPGLGVDIDPGFLNQHQKMTA